ncbi:nickel/cobalt transporter [Sulfitobacter sp. PS-8MA]|uniref:nickel/cobalt transporter n=1 Tax=Sulfitobacter sp. PS-8MA TaxID=3237707 RepID=UPI0034C5B730
MRKLITLAALVTLVTLAALWWTGGFAALAQWAAGQQRGFQNSIAGGLRATRGGDMAAFWTVLLASFAYGVVHAAGPGHGKIVIGGYGLARQVPMLRLSLIALAASLGQAVTAVALVYAGIMLLGLGREALVGVTESIMAPVSYAAIALIGLWLIWRGLRHARRTSTAGPDAVCGHCGHAHGPSIEAVQQAGNLRDALLLIGGIAMRPCTGALFVLVITWHMGIGGVGVLGAFAMALGTGLVTIATGLAATGLRAGLLGGFSGSPRLAQAAALAELTAGMTVVVLASGLLLRAL